MQHSRSDLQVHLVFTFCSAIWHDGDEDSLSNLFETLEIIGEQVTGIYYLYSMVADTYEYFAIFAFIIIFGMREQSAFLLIFGFSHGVYEVGDFGFTGEVNDTIRVFSTYYSYMGCAIFGFP